MHSLGGRLLLQKQEAMRADPRGCRHLPKNFDNVHNLEFRKDAEGNPTKIAIGMYSGEHTLYRSRSCVGQVRSLQERLQHNVKNHSMCKLIACFNAHASKSSASTQGCS